MASLRGKKIAVLGTLDPGVSAVRFLGKQGAKVSLFGLTTDLTTQRIREELKGIPYEFHPGPEIAKGVLNEFDGVVLTPGGGRLFQSRIDEARAAGVKVITDLDLALTHYKAPVIAVTGTNGKSTVVHLLKAIMEAAGKKVVAAGGDYLDFGDSLLQSGALDYVLLELNSSRLDRVATLNPFIAVMMNIYAGHSERHKSFKDYALAKGKIYRDQKPGNYFVFQKFSEPIQRLIKEQPPQGQMVPFAFKGPLEQGAWLDPANKELVFAGAGGEKSIVRLDRFSLPGTHNVENALAAFTVAKLCGISDEAVQKAFEQAGPPRDRMEIVAKLDGVVYINDARASNSTATLSSLHGFPDRSVVLVAGGEISPHSEDKYLLEMMKKKVKVLVIFGTKRRQFFKIWGETAETFVVPELKDAVEVASNHAEKGNIVLFSPASRPEMHTHGSTQKRGEEFRRVVKEVEEMVKARRTLSRRI